ncbi:13750_t:CDS:1, partial [Gigaspora rosea]
DLTSTYSDNFTPSISSEDNPTTISRHLSGSIYESDLILLK